MHTICLYLEAGQTFSSPYHQFCERMRLENGLTLQSSLPPHVVVKGRTELQDMSPEHLALHLGVLISRFQLKQIHSAILAPVESPIEGSEEITLRLPVEGREVIGTLGSVINFFAHELRVPRSKHEGMSPCITLIERVAPAHRASAFAIAKAMPWPSDPIIFDSIVIAHERDGVWSSFRKVPLLKA